MNSHSIEIFNCAYDDDVVLDVSHDLELIFLPADDGFLYEDLALRAQVQAPQDVLLVLCHVVRDVATGAAEGVARADNRGEADLVDDAPGLIPRMGEAAARNLQAALLHALFELVALLGLFDAAKVRANHLHAVLL